MTKNDIYFHYQFSIFNYPFCTSAEGAAGATLMGLCGVQIQYASAIYGQKRAKMER